MRSLEIVHTSGATFDIQSGDVVGRGQAADVHLGAVDVSRRHAKFWSDGLSWYVQDEGSLNGTFVNGTRASGPTPLRLGDTVRLAAHHFLVAHEKEA